MKVRDIMTELPLSTPETSLGAAARLMRDADYGTLPVIDSQGRLVGIMTDRDVCLTVASTDRNGNRIAVREAMTQKVFSALLDDDVHSALATMKGAHVRRLPVRDEFVRGAERSHRHARPRAYHGEQGRHRAWRRRSMNSPAKRRSHIRGWRGQWQPNRRRLDGPHGLSC